MQASLCILHRPTAALANASLDGDETAPLLRLVGLLPLVPQRDRDDCLMGTLPNELLLGAGSVGGRRPDTQDLLDGLQHSALAAAVLARDKVDVGTACTADKIAWSQSQVTGGAMRSRTLQHTSKRNESLSVSPC